MIRAGYSKDTCIDSLRFMHEVNGDGGKPDKADTHPSLSERIESLSEKDFSGLLNKEAKYNSSKWKYDRVNNFILYIPQS